MSAQTAAGRVGGRAGGLAGGGASPGVQALCCPCDDPAALGLAGGAPCADLGQRAAAAGAELARRIEPADVDAGGCDGRQVRAAYSCDRKATSDFTFLVRHCGVGATSQ